MNCITRNVQITFRISREWAWIEPLTVPSKKHFTTLVIYCIYPNKKKRKQIVLRQTSIPMPAKNYKDRTIRRGSSP